MKTYQGHWIRLKKRIDDLTTQAITAHRLYNITEGLPPGTYIGQHDEDNVFGRIYNELIKELKNICDESKIN